MRTTLLLLGGLCGLTLSIGCEQAPPCEDGPCPTSQVVDQTTYWGDDPILLPSKPGQKWHLTILLSDDYRRQPADRLFMSWFQIDPTLRSLVAQAEPHFRQPKDAYYRKWAPFTEGKLPAVCLQDPAGNRVYTAVADGVVKHGNGSQIKPIPETPSMLADDMRAAVASWEGFIDVAGPAGNVQGTDYEIGPGGRLLWNRCRPRPEPEPEPEPDDDDTTTTDLERIFGAGQASIQQQQAPPPRRATVPVWVPIVCGVFGLLAALAIGVIRRIHTESQQ